MALKDWELIKKHDDGGYSYMHKKYKHFVILYSPKSVYSFKGKWGVSYEPTLGYVNGEISKEFKTKKEAEKYAMNFMRKN